MKKIIILSVFIIALQSIIAQKIQTIYYDENWKVVINKDESKYYRTIENGDGLITDYLSSNGSVFSKVKSALIIDKKDDRKSKFIGKRLYYNLNGVIVKTDIYNNEGNLIESYTLDELNEIKTKSSFDSNQILINTVFYSAGKIQKERNYINGTNECIETFYENGNKYKQIIYTDSVPKYDWYTKWDEKGKSAKYYIKSNQEYKSDKAKVFYKDGIAYQYYSINGIGVTVCMKIEKQYGNYYATYVGVANLTGTEFNVSPNDIRVTLINDDAESVGEVLSSNEYMKKVTNKQKWSAALNAIGQGIATLNAGYSTSVSVAGATDGANSAVGVGVSQSYNGANNYFAQQNAQNNINNLKKEQYQIKKELNQGYLKLNTIFNEERIYGQVNVVFKQANEVKVIVLINGVDYEFIFETTDLTLAE